MSLVFKILGVLVLVLIGLFVLIITIGYFIQFIISLSKENEMYDGYDDFYD